MGYHRIVSLIASSTEITAALGCADHLVGRSHECDYPPDVQRLPVVTRPTFPTAAPSGDIDRSVKSLLEQGLSIYSVDVDLLRSLSPSVIITQTQCEVCAVSLGDVERALCEWIDSRPQIVSLEPNCLADVWSDIRRVAAALDAHDEGETLIRNLQHRIDAITEQVDDTPPELTFVSIEWIEPLMTAGNWMPELVDLAGACNLLGTAGEHSPWMTWEDLVTANPDVLFISPCGFTIEQTRRDMHKLTERDGWDSLKAVQTGRVYLADGNQYFHRPGPRLVESLEILAEMLDPGTFDFGHRGVGWEPLNPNANPS
ncbi:MAG: ABC transporter substrate-binding protein [candidate division Zixibacteria bacterium]|nr:ABC transporter substrate-binding protein [candidate division Zixibacteria bacterium]